MERWSSLTCLTLQPVQTCDTRERSPQPLRFFSRLRFERFHNQIHRLY